MTDLILKSFAMYGLVIVISLLSACLIKIIVAVLAKAENRKQSNFKVTKGASPAAPDAIPAEHVAAIAAAVQAMSGTHRIVHIADGRGTSSWSLEGKLLQQSSHDVHRTKR